MFSTDSGNILLAIEIMFGNPRQYSHWITKLSNMLPILNIEESGKDGICKLLNKNHIVMSDDLSKYEKLHILKNIKSIDIRSNYAKKLPSWLIKFDNIETIDMNSFGGMNKFTGKDLEIIGNLKNLTWLHTMVRSDRLHKFMTNLRFANVMGIYYKPVISQLLASYQKTSKNITIMGRVRQPITKI